MMQITLSSRILIWFVVLTAMLALSAMAHAEVEPTQSAKQVTQFGGTAPRGRSNDARIAGDRQAATDLAELSRRFAGQFFETGFDGVYVNDPGSREAVPQLFTSGARIAINNGVLGMTKGPGGPPLDEIEQRRFLQPLLPSLRVDKFIQFGGHGPLQLVILSGIDCPACRKLESRLAAGHLRYAVVPNAINPENIRYVRDAYCSAEPARAWSQALLYGRKPASAPVGCDFDFRHYWIISGLLGGSTPRLLYADGSMARSSGDNPLPAIQAKLAQLSRDGVTF